MKSSTANDVWAWIGGLTVLAILVLLWIPVSQIGTDATILRQWIEPFGLFAPVAYFLLNIAQIVIAPLPGYPVQVLGGVLFGPILGSICAVGGMTAGGVLAAWLGRRFGRSWLEQRVGVDTFAQWSDIAAIHTFWTWWIILLIPLGDLPYFFAGLSRLSLSRFALAILTSRGPFTVLIVWLGDQAVTLPLGWLSLLLIGVGIIVLIGVSQRARLEAWGQAYINRKVNHDQ